MVMGCFLLAIFISCADAGGQLPRPAGTLSLARDFSPWFASGAQRNSIEPAQGLKSLAKGASLRDERLIAEAAKPPLLRRLDGARRAKVLAALAGLIILGFGLVLLAWLGARATCRYMNREPVLHDKPPAETPVREKDWADKPLGKPFEEEP